MVRVIFTYRAEINHISRRLASENRPGRLWGRAQFTAGFFPLKIYPAVVDENNKTSFYFEQSMKQDTKPDINWKAKKVLVVDDFFNFRLTLKNMMRALGILYLDDAANGEEAVRKMAVRRYDIILCDYNLGPGKSGQQVLEEGRYKGHISAATVFIMVTAENTEEMILGAAEYQPDDYLMKPFAKEILEKRIRNILTKKGNLRNIEKAIDDGDYDRACGICDDLAAKNTGNLTEILKLKGEALLKKGDYGQAADFYDGILARGNVVWALLGRGRADLLSGRYAEAQATFEQMIAQNSRLMAAYDYLAQTLVKMRRPQEAQDILMKAAAISPRALLRRKNLGRLAYDNEDFDTARTSFQSVVEQGKHSCLKSPEDYTRLAKTLTRQNAPQEGLQVLAGARKEFPDDESTRLHVSVAESYIYTRMNRTEDAARALAGAEHSAARLSSDLPDALALDLAEAYIMAGETEKGSAIAKSIVSRRHDDEETLDGVRRLFSQAGLVAEGDKLIETTRNEIIRLNNEGVAMAREGRLDEAIAYFEEAAARLPENKIINANAAHVIMLRAKEGGGDAKDLEKARSYLDAVRRIDETYGDWAMLMAMYRELSAQEE